MAWVKVTKKRSLVSLFCTFCWDSKNQLANTEHNYRMCVLLAFLMHLAHRTKTADIIKKKHRATCSHCTNVWCYNLRILCKLIHLKHLAD